MATAGGESCVWHISAVHWVFLERVRITRCVDLAIRVVPKWDSCCGDMLMGEKYLECSSAHGSNAKSQPGRTWGPWTWLYLAVWVSDLQHFSVTRPGESSGPLGNTLLFVTHGSKLKNLHGTKFHSAAMRLVPVLHKRASSALCPSLLCCSPHNLPAGQGGRVSR